MELDILRVKKDYEEYNSYIANFPKFSLEMPMSFGRMYGYTIHILDSGKIELREGKASNEKSKCDSSGNGSTFSIEELHSIHSGLIAVRPHLNERTKGYKTTLNLINKLSGMIAEYYR